MRAGDLRKIHSLACSQPALCRVSASYRRLVKIVLYDFTAQRNSIGSRSFQKRPEPRCDGVKCHIRNFILLQQVARSVIAYSCYFSF